MMVEISKHMFETACRDVHCSDFIHPECNSCWRSFFLLSGKCIPGSAKFYFLVHLMQNIFKGKKILNRKALLKAGEYYVRSTALGVLITSSTLSLSCLFRWLLGRKFKYYTFVFAPSMLSGVLLLLEPPSRRGLIVNLFINMVIEYWMRSLERSGYITITKTKMTFLFMMGSALLFYLMRLEGERKKRTPLIWLFTPEKVRQKSNNTKDVCPHNGPCLRYIIKGTAAYFGVGLALSSVKLFQKFLIAPMKTLSSISGRHMKLALFFGSYIGIYRAIVCYLCRQQGFDSPLYALPAGYLAGLSFLFSPNLGFAIASLTGVVKLYSTTLYDKKIIPDSSAIPVLLYCVCQSILYHARFMHPEVCPSYVFNLLRSVSSGSSEMISSNLQEILKRAI